MIRRLAALFAVTLALSGAAVAQQTVAAHKTNEAAYFPLQEVKAGQKGVAYTVFSGTVPEEFKVEVLGVLPGYPQPRQSIIIARISGTQAERTGVFAGMSGSPVYIDGRLAGAIAYSFPFSKEPIAGITPIRQMIDIFEGGAVQSGERDQLGFPREPRAVSFAQLGGSDFGVVLPKSGMTSATFLAPVAAGSPLANLLGQQLAPIATPVVFGGISAETLSRFAPQLQAIARLSRERIYATPSVLQIEAAGFEILQCRRFDFTPGGLVPKIPHILGCARRP
jgi:hypothetical protein